MNVLPIFKESLGWLAMVAFAASYLCKNAVTLRRAQAGAAVVWILYGFASGAAPVGVSNVVVAFMAVIYPVIRQRMERPSGDLAKIVDEPVSPSAKRLTLPRHDVPMAQPFGW